MAFAELLRAPRDELSQGVDALEVAQGVDTTCCHHLCNVQLHLVDDGAGGPDVLLAALGTPPSQTGSNVSRGWPNAAAKLFRAFRSLCSVPNRPRRSGRRGV